jgi:fibronectin-binding autotransporter adhesin
VNSDGTLAGTGKISGDVTINDGGSLHGTLTLMGEVTIADGATVAPGASPGTLTINNSFVLNPASNLAFELSGTDQTEGGSVNDLITGVADLTLDGVLLVTETVPGSFLSAQAGDSWRLINYSGVLDDDELSLGSMPALSSGLAYFIDTATFGQVNLEVAMASVPEASAVVAMGIVALLSSAAVWIRKQRGANRPV